MDALSRNIGIRLNVEKSFIPKAEYIFRTFCKIIGIQPNFYYTYTLEDIHVYYGPQLEDRYPVEIYYNQEAAIFYEKKKTLENSTVHFCRYRENNVPFLFSLLGKIYQYTPTSLEIRKDIIASSFFFLSCWQEYTLMQKGDEGKIDLSGKFQRIWDIDDFPIVDRYCDIFQKALEAALPGYQKENRWKSDKYFAVSLSHLIMADSESVNNNKLFSISRNKLLNHPSICFMKERISPFKQREKEFFYPTLFFPIREKTGKPYLDHQMGSDKLQLLSNTNNRPVGITADRLPDRVEIEETKQFLIEQGFLVEGFCLTNNRYHYQEFFKLLESLEFKYDTSISYSAFPGYRAGTSYPFYPFNIEKNIPFSVLEIPPIISTQMTQAEELIKSDSISFPYKKSYARNLISYLSEYTQTTRSHISVSWNDFLPARNSQLTYRSLWKLLKSFYLNNAWLCSLNEIYHYWSNR